MSPRLTALVIGLFVSAAASAESAAQSVEVTADTREIYAGLPFSILVEASGFDEDPEPAAPELEIADCAIVFAGTSPRVVRSTSIVNGRRTDRMDVTFVFRYQVTPPKPGTYKIPPIEVVQGAKKARSRERSFKAKSVKRTSKMALRVEIPERPVWLGETFEVNVDWYLSVDPARPSFGIPLFAQPEWVTVKPAEEIIGRRRQSVTFNAGKSELELGYSQERAELDGKPFTRLRFQTLVTPLQSGTLELPPARVVSGLEVGSGRDRFGFPVAKSEIFEAVDRARRLVVKPLPQTGRPKGFKNAVGTGFSIDVQASRTVVRVGDPIELTVTVRSESRLAGMALPDLNVLLDPNHFTVGDDEPVGQLAGDGKIKTFQVIAQLKSSDVREVPPLELAFFNPTTASYESARSQPIALQVAGSAVVGASQVARAGVRADARDGDPAQVSLVGADLALSSAAVTLDEPTTLRSLSPILIVLYAVPVLLFAFMTWRRSTEGSRAAHGARKKRGSAFDNAIDAARAAPSKQAAADLAGVLRGIKKEHHGAAEGYHELIADLETAAYNPRASSAPLESGLVARCEKIGRTLLAGLVVLLCVSLAPLHADAEQASSSLESARQLYDQAIGAEAGGEGGDEKRRRQFARAAAEFAAAVQEHPKSPSLLIDWGNASLGARELGWSVLAYRRALHLDQGNQRARTNLGWVRGSLPGWTPKPTDSGALASLFFWHGEWSLARRHLVAAFAFAIAVLLLVPWRPRRPLWTVATSVFAFILVIAMLVSVLVEPDRGADAVVVRDAETLRAADSPSAAAVFARPLPAGLEVTVTETRERWSQVELADGQRGWLPQSSLEMVVE